MMCVTNAPLCRRVTLRHCLALVGLTTLLPVCGVTTWWLALDSLPLNLWNAYLGYQFYKDSDTRSARRLFRLSLIYLPILMLMILIHKKPRTEQEEVVAVQPISQLYTNLVPRSLAGDEISYGRFANVLGQFATFLALISALNNVEQLRTSANRLLAKRPVTVHCMAFLMAQFMGKIQVYVPFFFTEERLSTSRYWR